MVAEAYKSGAAVVEGVNPVYLAAAGAIAASGIVLLTCGCRGSRGSPKKPKTPSASRSKKRLKASKSRPAIANGIPRKNGGGNPGGGVVAGESGGGSTAASSRGTGGKSESARGDAVTPAPSGVKVTSIKPAKKSTAKVVQAQGKGKGKAAPEAPPVITVRKLSCIYGC